MPPTDIISGDDFRQIFSDALTSFSPLATLVGADSARAFAHEVTNKKQTVFATLAPIGALGMMATVCKASDLPGVKDLLGAGDTDILDAAADVGCYVLYGLVPRMSKRGGITCKGREVNRGVAACALVTLDWNLGEKKIDFEPMRAFLREFSAATVTGRIEWECDNLNDLLAKLKDVRDRISQSLEKGPFDSDSHMAVYEELENVQGGRGYVELHWPSPSLPLETRPYILYISIGGFLLIFLVIAVFTASPLLDWQSPQASALLFGGQLVLGLAQTLTHVIIKRLRTVKSVKIPAAGVVPDWQLVDSTWFINSLARRSLGPSRRGDHFQLGQHYRFSRLLITRWEALLTLFLLIIGFLAFYIGAKSSDVRTVIIFIFLYVIANGSKGYIIHLANVCYYTPLNNFGWHIMTPPQDEKSQQGPWWRFWKRSSARSDNRSAASDGEHSGSPQEEEALVDVPPPELSEKGMGPAIPLPELKTDGISTHDREVTAPPTTPGSIHHQPFWDMPKDALNPMLIPLPPSHDGTPTPSQRASVVSSMQSRASSSRTRHRAGTRSSRHTSYTSLRSVGDRMYGATLHVDTSNRTYGARPTSPVFAEPIPGIAFDVEYRLYAKVAVRNMEAIGMFYFSRTEEWAMAAHVIHTVVRRYLGDMGWQHPVGKEPVCEMDFEVMRSAEERQPKVVHALLLILVDALRHEDLFWYTGQEICAIIMECFTDARHIPSEHPMATETWVICEWVYIVCGIALRTEPQRR
uniref:BRCT domain-containing protein n=1 Tax=Schizophyllum commune (strain H4-8 / FGSC 9210) TaxID=578458 RepID=D8PRE3_SCHCM